MAKEKSIIIDPGHGGTDPGAVGFGVREKDWALEISLYQYKRMKELGAKVGITRTSDRTLSATPRTNLIRNKYDYCVSNHRNAFNGSARGIETIHSVFGGKEFAQDLANKLVSVSGLPLRRVFTRKNNSGKDWYYMHRMTGNTRTVIVEYGFIDNKQDNDWYKDKANFKKAAEAVIEVICKHIGIKYIAPDGSVAVAPSKPATSQGKPKPAPSKPKPAPKPSKPKLAVDGYLGPDTVSELQRHFGLIVDGEMWGQYKGNQATKAFNQKAVKYGRGGSPVVRALQKKIGAPVDGIWGRNTTSALQRYLGTVVDGEIWRPSRAIKELQRRLNNGTF